MENVAAKFNLFTAEFIVCGGSEGIHPLIHYNASYSLGFNLEMNFISVCTVKSPSIKFPLHLVRVSHIYIYISVKTMLIYALDQFLTQFDLHKEEPLSILKYIPPLSCSLPSHTIDS